VYYFVAKSAFQESIGAVFGETVQYQTNIIGVTTAVWGLHWIYRLVAETVSIAFATLITAGLARGRERTGAIVGGLAISLGYVVFWIVFGISLRFSVPVLLDTNPGDNLIAEPWYQHAIDGLLVVASPLIGVFLSDPAKQLNTQKHIGFFGISRFHLFWLFIPAYWYAASLIGPIAYIWTHIQPGSSIQFVILLLLTGVPISALIAPGFYGVALLAGYKGATFSPLVRNFLGVIVLVIGLLIGGVIQFGWVMLLRWLFG
jgi:hypothetical protein